MQCDHEKNGLIMTRDLIELIHSQKLKFSRVLLNFFLNALSEDDDGNSLLEKFYDDISNPEKPKTGFVTMTNSRLSFSKLQSLF